MGPMPRDTIPLGGSGGQVGILRTSDRDHVYSVCIYTYLHIYTYRYTSSTAQGGGGSFKNRKRIGEIDCCE